MAFNEETFPSFIQQVPPPYSVHVKWVQLGMLAQAGPQSWLCVNMLSRSFER
jgi:hypothetical protein